MNKELSPNSKKEKAVDSPWTVRPTAAVEALMVALLAQSPHLDKSKIINAAILLYGKHGAEAILLNRMAELEAQLTRVRALVRPPGAPAPHRMDLWPSRDEN